MVWHSLFIVLIVIIIMMFHVVQISLRAAVTVVVAVVTAVLVRVRLCVYGQCCGMGVHTGPAFVDIQMYFRTVFVHVEMFRNSPVVVSALFVLATASFPRLLRRGG